MRYVSKNFSAFVGVDLSIYIFLDCLAAAPKIKDPAIYTEAGIWVRKKRVYITVVCQMQVCPYLV